MSEYKFVEKPFLDQLEALGWIIVNQGEGIPGDFAGSLRTDFREVTLKAVFKQSVAAINSLDDGRQWLTDKQLDDLHAELTDQAAKGLLEANKTVLEQLYKQQVDINEVTGEEYPVVKLIDFDNPEANSFHAINQFRIDTPGRVKSFIIPDLVLFVNGLPLVVIECKDKNIYTSNPIYEAITQLRRYSDQREDTIEAGLKEGEERLFHFNQLMIATTGDETKFGTITSTSDYYYSWKTIYPSKYQDYVKPLGVERPQEVLIQGMLPKDTLLDIVRNFMLYMDAGDKQIKVVCRYQQYRAVLKTIEKLRTGSTSMERSGVIWHTQGSGKSLTMVFLVRKLRQSADLKDYKVLMVNDRVDLEEQLTKTAALTGEKVYVINSSTKLKSDLANDSSNLNMVMVHKFKEAETMLPDYVAEALSDYGDQPIPKKELFGVINNSEKMLVLIDEAHRTQSSELGDNLFAAFPNAARIAFTGTPLITEKHKKKTWERFGGYIDKYKLQDAVDDGATIQILYEGKTADTAINEKHQFDTKFDDLFQTLTDEQILKIKKKYGCTGNILDAPKRIEAIANNMVNHYVEQILPNGFKAQVVCNSKIAVVHYQTYIDQAIQERLEQEKQLDSPDAELIKQLEFIKTAVVLSSDNVNEDARVTKAVKSSREMNAIDNFKKKFDYEKPGTGIAFMIVCDMLLTGFDAPIEQVMYIDKKVKEHNLLQTIARVNRVAKDKSRGFIVDYIGLANHLKYALSIYSEDDQADILGQLKNINTEIPIIEERYNRLLQLFTDNKISNIEAFVTQQIKDSATEYQTLEKAVDLMEDIKLRANLEVYFKKFLQSLDIILPAPAANPYKVPAYRFGYILNKVKERYKDASIDISGAGAKVRKLISEHLISLGINPKIPPVELMSDAFIKELDKNTSSRAKASEMEHAIRKHCKVNWDEDPALYAKLSEKLETLMKKHQEDWDQLSIELKELRDEVKEGRKESDSDLDIKQAPFYDLIIQIAFGKDDVNPEQAAQIKQMVIEAFALVKERINIINFWKNGYEIDRMKGDLSDLLLMTNVDEIINAEEQLVTEITSLAKHRTKDILA
ncbi:type I restriction enzyme, R subunit [Desulfuromusa kysingii]|uniref:Type I restriction enzyme endonuclease subunit n=1 Tax=Desulfuromusa kysingii TaxID=37625 RepID=A0A1H3YYP6_9BACT|nr:HsdR family type I site-specific deoxyribonuclease [Desulfuromusa kysingii]SEA16537.1 type I restriction enzyme, R subunit [Desulfuromusa kysingii]